MIFYGSLYSVAIGPNSLKKKWCLVIFKVDGNSQQIHIEGNFAILC